MKQQGLPGFCACGCGQSTSLIKETHRRLGQIKGQHYRFVAGHNMHLPPRPCAFCQVMFRPPARGLRHCSPECWAGAKKAASKQRYTGDGNKQDHRKIAERVLGKPLPAGAQVHHVDGSGRNNDHRNLVICQDDAYHKLLHVRARVLRAGGDPNAEKICYRCRRPKPFAEFGNDTGQRVGLRGECKACSSLHQRCRLAAFRIVGHLLPLEPSKRRIALAFAQKLAECDGSLLGSSAVDLPDAINQGRA